MPNALETSWKKFPLSPLDVSFHNPVFTFMENVPDFILSSFRNGERVQYSSDCLPVPHFAPVEWK
jgi:hypothetical protein